MLMPGRSYSPNNATNKYRYGFNGKESDNEVKGEGNEQDYGKRIYDPRLGRFLSVDPLQANYPELTSYQFASNSPVANIDLDGLEKIHFIYEWHSQTGLTFIKTVTQTYEGSTFEMIRYGANASKYGKYNEEIFAQFTGGNKLTFAESVDVYYYNDDKPTSYGSWSTVRNFSSFDDFFKANHSKIATEQTESLGDEMMVRMSAQDDYYASTDAGITSDVHFQTSVEGSLDRGQDPGGSVTIKSAAANKGMSPSGQKTNAASEQSSSTSSNFGIVREGLKEVNKIVKNGTVNESTLKSFVPSGSTNTFVPSENIKSGYKYDFNFNGTTVQIKWHSPDANAALKFPGSNSGKMWTAQIQIGNKLLGSDGKMYSKPNNLTHIPVKLGH
jgi:RHS repeat-associated protein